MASKKGSNDGGKARGKSVKDLPPRGRQAQDVKGGKGAALNASAALRPRGRF